MKPKALTTFFLLLHVHLWAGNVLDKTGNPTATALVAFSVRQLSSQYTGYAIQVRRSHDNATLNIGYTSAGDLDTATMKTFVGADTCYVTTWYDQSGNGYNATQTTNYLQPYLMTGGTISRENGWPSLYTSQNGFLIYGAVSQLTGTYQVTRMDVCCSRSSSLAITEGLGTYQLDLELFPTASFWVQFENHNIVATAAVSSTQPLMSINSVRSNGNSSIYLNSALMGSTTGSLLTFSAPVMGYVGVRFDYAINNTGQGAFSEMILFNSVLSATDQTAIDYNENWYYSLGFVPCSSTQAALSTNGMTTKALYACTQDGPYAYYYDPAHPLNLIFGIAKDPGGTGANPSFSADSINLTVTSNPAAVIYSAKAGINGVFALGRYWNVYTHTPLTSPVNIRFFYNPSDTVAALDSALAFKAASGALAVSNLQWFKTVGTPFNPDSLTATPLPGVKGTTLTFTPVYGTKNGINYVEYDGVPSFSGGTGVYLVSNSIIPLPILISPFTATPVNNTVLLDWTAQSEFNGLGFEVERSDDGKTWTPIGQVNSGGTSYSFTDVSPFGYPSSNDYRLKLLYQNGQYAYTGIVVASMPAGVAQLFKTVPNPFQNDLEISGNVPNGGPVEIRLVELTGDVLLRQAYTAVKGQNVFQLRNLGRLPAGMYFVLVLQAGGVVGVGKVVKE
jgi:hypothetical protein